MVIDGVNMLPGMAEYPRNQWYVAGWSHEFGREKALARDICGEPVALYRAESGEPRAVFNRCPHRGMPLTSATGRVVGDTLQCGYHGIRFGPDGKCVEVPSGGVIPARMCVKTYPLVELAHWVWIWMGDPALADPALIPDHHAVGLTDPAMFTEPGIHLEVKANYLLPLENLVDATHITYLHHGLIDSGNVAGHPYQLEADGPRIATVREFVNEAMPPMLRMAMNIKGERVNRRLRLVAFSNNLCMISMGFNEVDDAPGTPPRRMELLVAITPGGPRLTHQFGTLAGSYPNHYPGRFDDLRNLLMEDVVVIEEIQQLFDRLGPENAPEVSIRSDEANIRSRRVLAAMIQSERAPTAGTVVIQPVVA